METCRVPELYLGSNRSQTGVTFQQGEASLFPQSHSVSCLQLLNHSGDHKKQQADGPA